MIRGDYLFKIKYSYLGYDYLLKIFASCVGSDIGKSVNALATRFLLCQKMMMLIECPFVAIDAKGGDI